MPKGDVPDLAAFLRFVHGDDLGMVVRSHLAVEVVLTRALDRSRSRRQVDRLSFMGKVDAAIASREIGFIGDHREGYVIANRIRNHFAHELDATLTEGDATDFFAAFHPSTWDGFMFRSYQAALRDTPHGRVAFGFATLFVYAAIESKLLPDVLEAIHRRGIEVASG